MTSAKPLVLYSTLSRKKEVFKPRVEGKVGMYVCGVTVYDYCHIGHGRTFIAFDVIRRWLEARGNEVTFVRNVTDVDDKIIRRAAERGISTKDLTDEFTRAMQEDMASLGCLAPTYEPHATDFIGDMQSVIGKLFEKGYAYVGKDGDVDYAVRKFQGYGKLSGKSLDDLEPGARIGVDSGKRDPLDFVLWKRAKPGEPHWPSPWGEGRPGWHIECSAMSCHYLGENFDIHGGGPDLIFPHHENEIAQSEAANGKPFANYWMHSGPLRVRAADGTEQKMSKSLHNFWTIRDALKETDEKFGEGNGSQVLRFFLMRTQYRSPISFNTGLIEDAHKGLTRLYDALAGVPGDGKPLDWAEPHAAAFADAMNDDFNTPVAIAQLFELANDVNRTKDPALARQLKALGAILNILQGDPAKFLKGAAGAAMPEEEIRKLIEERAAAKKARNFARADEIRDTLASKGITLLDTPQGTTWRSA
ncbi:MAG: cysteine--tRNA ligase [Sutterellaceae bacterium]|nr:cysteine--tRNA ligase [Sutterellaceae bacterium]MDD7441253.1 cysteine--tRNA ligase [Sutterellaceae bacterium]MDY2867560.1 cysteine--tRNA ligase [Mesosutterella sp.]